MSDKCLCAMTERDLAYEYRSIKHELRRKGGWMPPSKDFIFAALKRRHPCRCGERDDQLQLFKNLVISLKRGDCWREKGIGNPLARSHSGPCEVAQLLIKGTPPTLAPFVTLEIENKNLKAQVKVAQEALAILEKADLCALNNKLGWANIISRARVCLDRMQRVPATPSPEAAGESVSQSAKDETKAKECPTGETQLDIWSSAVLEAEELLRPIANTDTLRGALRNAAKVLRSRHDGLDPATLEAVRKLAMRTFAVGSVWQSKELAEAVVAFVSQLATVDSLRAAVERHQNKKEKI